MPTLTCPDCLARFPAPSQRGRAAVCPTCGGRVGEPVPVAPRRPDPDEQPRRSGRDDRPSRRSRDDDPPPRSRRREPADRPNPLAPLYLVVGVVSGMVLLSGFGAAIYAAATKEPADADRAAATNPSAGPSPGPTAAKVTLSNLRRGGFRGRGELLVDYEYTAGSPSPGSDVLVVEARGRQTDVTVPGGFQRRNTVSWSQPAGTGPVTVWMERRDRGRLGKAAVISNKLTLY